MRRQDRNQSTLWNEFGKPGEATLFDSTGDDGETFTVHVGMAPRATAPACSDCGFTRDAVRTEATRGGVEPDAAICCEPAAFTSPNGWRNVPAGDDAPYNMTEPEWELLEHAVQEARR